MNWLDGDRAMHYLGWAFLRQEGTWSFPPTWTSRLGFPIGFSVSFTDCLPLIAVVLRPFQSLLPEPFQYLGVFTVASFVLQFYFSYRLTEHLTPSRAQTFLGGTMLALAPTYLARLAFHVPFAAQWLLLAALSAYFQSPAKGHWRWYRPQVVLAALASSIDVYIAFQVCAIAAAAALRLLLERRAHIVQVLGFLFAAAAACLFSLWVFGFLSTNVELANEGYGYYSMNLLAPFNPAPLVSILLPPLPEFTGQYEGFNYLGLGILFCLAIGFYARQWSLGELKSAKLAPLSLLCLVLSVLAVSNKITVGNFIVAEIALPDIAFKTLSAFRGSGRMFWPANYLIMLGAVVLITRSFKQKIAFKLITAAFLIQMIDVAYMMKDRISLIQTLSAPPQLASPMWRALREHHRHLSVLPAYQCDHERTPGKLAGFQLFGLIALENRITINSYATARRIPESEMFHCHKQIEQVARGEVDQHTAYVLSDDLAKEVIPRLSKSHDCERVDGYNLCIAKVQ